MPPTGGCSLIDATSSTVAVRPLARHHPRLLQPMQRRVERTFGHIEVAAASSCDSAGEFVAMPRRLGEHGEQQAVEMPPQKVSASHEANIHRQPMYVHDRSRTGATKTEPHHVGRDQAARRRPNSTSIKSSIKSSEIGHFRSVALSVEPGR